MKGRKFLIVGTGSIGRRHFGNLQSLGYRDIAVLRSKRGMDAQQREFFSRYRPQVFYNLKAALAEKPDAVLVCNPTSLHVSTARSAIRAGSHVFIEKPISHTRAGIDSLLREARKRKRIIYVGYHFRHHPLLKITKRLLDDGKLGELLAARFVTGEYLPAWHPWENYRKGYAGLSDLGGGVVLTQSHDLDLVQWFFGKPRSITAAVRNSGILGIDTDDLAALTITTERCPIVTSHLDYLTRPPVKNFVISGSKGNLHLDYYQNKLRFTRPDGKMRVVKAPAGFERNQMYIAELKDFIRCIRRGTSPASDGYSGRAVLEMALGGKEASRRGQTLDF
ncbi:MAG: Gfo/Idh/MocA family oxidoreductase [Candidatus Sungiibacteriota bacterium]